jgi:hypothetical protein
MFVGDCVFIGPSGQFGADAGYSRGAAWGPTGHPAFYDRTGVAESAPVSRPGRARIGRRAAFRLIVGGAGGVLDRVVTTAIRPGYHRIVAIGRFSCGSHRK